jgi:hypothetical protein
MSEASSPLRRHTRNQRALIPFLSETEHSVSERTVCTDEWNVQKHMSIVRVIARFARNVHQKPPQLAPQANVWQVIWQKTAMIIDR